MNASTPVTHVDFYFDFMCPWAYQTSLWIKDVAAQTELQVSWKFFSLEEINREEGKKHPWERDISYGWTPLRIAAWLRRIDMKLCGDWYGVIGNALHIDGSRPYEKEIANELLQQIGAPASTWDEALADQTTHDDVRQDHERAVKEYAGFGVPILVFPNNRATFGPVVVPAPSGEQALQLWDLTVAYNSFPGLYEMKTPKTASDLQLIGEVFNPYLRARQWNTVQNPAP